SGRDEQNLAGFERDRRLAFKLIFERAFEDVDDLFARMGVPRGRRSRRDLDDDLERLASGDAHIVPREIDALEARRLRQRASAPDDHGCCSNDSSRFHVDLLSSWGITAPLAAT